MLDTTAIIGAIKYTISDIQYRLQSPKTGKIEDAKIDFKCLQELANTAIESLKNDGGTASLDCRMTSTDYGYDVYRTLVVIKNNMKP